MIGAKRLYIAQMFRLMGNMESAKYHQQKAGEESTEMNSKSSIHDNVLKGFCNEL